MSVSSVFLYDPEKWTVDDILEFLEKQDLKVQKSRRMAYHLDDVPEDWPIRGYLIEDYDISFEPPAAHPQFGLVGRVHCTNASGARFSPEENRKIFNKLKKGFGMARADRDRKSNLYE